jgi:serine/threonine-protein kinase
MTEITGRLSTALADRYRIERRLGEGGMATVYLAEDLKHERKVAVKVLRPELAAVLGAERFVQEIKTTANLQHPHVLPLFDSGEADAFLYYVMPFIDGETLRDRLNRETQLGIDEAVNITTAIADALDYAHRNNVIHRDIKPENILLHDGRPMVADFGIALAVSAAAGGRMTETGMSLGTPHYMSPEQATADKDLTNRSDIYSLGSVLYEMLTGEPPHTAGSAQATIMKIVTEVAQPVTDIRKSVPPNVAAAVAKSLEKLPADRFESAKAFADAMKDPHFAVTPSAARLPSVHAPLRSHTRAMTGWGVAAVLALALVGMALWPASIVTTAPIPMRFTLELQDFDGLRFDEIAVSPDGSLIAMPDFEGIHLRSAGDASYRLLPEARAIAPAFSPDSKWLVFTREGGLFKSPVDGGSVQRLVQSNTLIASTPNWGYPGTIVFMSQGRLYQVSDAGGEPEPIGGGITGQRPKMLPDGSGVLYTGPEGIMLFEFDADTARLVVPEAIDASYIETGHLVYVYLDLYGLFAVPFDLRARAVTGSPVSVADDVTARLGRPTHSISRTGTLVHTTNPMDEEQARQLLLLDLNGGVDTIPLSPRTFIWPRFSPNGRSLSFNTGTGRIAQRTIHTYNLATGTTTQLTFEGGTHAAAWSPDGTRIVFSSERDGTIGEDLFIMPIDQSGPATHLLRYPGDEHAMAWPTEDYIVFNGDAGRDLLIVSPSVGEPQPTPYLNAEWVETELSVSPSGELATYQSDEAGIPQIYVSNFPEAQGRRLISSGGGISPRWAPDGQTVYYWSATQDTLFAAPVPRDQAAAGLPEVLAVVPGLYLLPGWDINRVTGQAVVMQVVEGDAEISTKVVVVVNWFEELKAMVGS